MIPKQVKDLIDSLIVSTTITFKDQLDKFRLVYPFAGAKKSASHIEIGKYWNTTLIKDSFSKFKAISDMFDKLNIVIDANAPRSLHFSGIYNTFYIRIFRKTVKSVDTLTPDEIEKLVPIWRLYVSNNPQFAEIEKTLNAKKTDSPAEPAAIADNNQQQEPAGKPLGELNQLELLELAKQVFQYLEFPQQEQFSEYALTIVDNKLNEKTKEVA